MVYGLWTMDYKKQKSRHEDGISLKQTKQSKRPSLENELFSHKQLYIRGGL